MQIFSLFVAFVGGFGTVTGKEIMTVFFSQCCLLLVGSLSENVPHRVWHLNTWSPVGGIVCIDLGGMA